jgi:protein ImuB
MFACLYIPPLASSPVSGVRRPVSERTTSDIGHRTPDDATGPRDVDLVARSSLAALAREFSPRVEVHGPGLVTIDARGLERLFGDANRLGDELRRAAADRGLPARIVIASTRPAAWLLAHARAGLTIVPAGEQQRWLSPLPLHVLEQLAAHGLGPGAGGRASEVRRGVPVSKDPAGPVAALVALLKRWGLATLGEFTRLPPLDLSERLGQQGLAWQAVARGEERAPLVPDAPEERFEETLDLEWPIEGLQPLSFVFGRLFDALSARLIDRDRAAAVLHIQLQLVTREVDRRSLQLPAPMRDARALRTLALLHLEAHPVTAGIDRVTVAADPVPGRVIQHSLLTRALPLPEQLCTLLARLGAVMGDDRCGMAALVDSHRPGAFEMKPFTADWHKAATAINPMWDRRPSGRWQHVPQDINPMWDRRNPLWDRRASARWQQDQPTLAIRRFRIPVPASVAVKDGRPARVIIDRQGLRGGYVEGCVGPWRTSGEWWRVADARVQIQPPASSPQPRAPSPRPPEVAWNRDEWDVNLSDGGVYRIYRDRERDRWFVDGVID